MVFIVMPKHQKMHIKVNWINIIIKLYQIHMYVHMYLKFICKTNEWV